MSSYEFEDEQTDRRRLFTYAINALACSWISPLASIRRIVGAYSLQSKHRDVMAQTHQGGDCVALSCDLAFPTAANPGWKYTRHGYKLLHNALQESQATDYESQALSRQLCIDGATYILHGLPNDLSPHETSKIQSALLPHLQTFQDPQPTRHHPPRAPSSLLHRGLASTIISLCLLIRLLLPYIKFLFAQASTYDRTHNVSGKVFSATVHTADSLGKKSLSVASTALGNEAVLAAIAYCIEGVSCGFAEGLEEGIKVIKAGGE